MLVKQLLSIAYMSKHKCSHLIFHIFTVWWCVYWRLHTNGIKLRLANFAKCILRGKRERLFLVDSCRSLSQLAWKKNICSAVELFLDALKCMYEHMSLRATRQNRQITFTFVILLGRWSFVWPLIPNGQIIMKITLTKVTLKQAFFFTDLKITQRFSKAK